MDWDSSGHLDQVPELVVAVVVLTLLVTAVSIATNGVFRTSLLLCKQALLSILMVYTAQQWWTVAISGSLLVPGVSWL